MLAVVGALVLGPAGSSVAHATLLSTDPVEGAVLDVAPERVTFTFDESVIGVPAGIKVFDATGTEVASSASVSASQLFVDIDEEVSDGTLVVLWRLVSEDGHPIGGSLTFSVGAPSDVVTVPSAGAEVDDSAPVVLSLVRGVGYLGLLVAAGTATFAVLFLPRDRRGDGARSRLRPVVPVAAAVAAVGWLAAVPLIALYQLGAPLSALAEPSTWTVLAPSEYFVPAVVVAGLILAVRSLPRGGAPDRKHVVGVLVGAGTAVVAPAFTGHTRAATPEALVILVDVLHVGAGALWLGGVVALALVLGDLTRDDTGAVVLARFSTWAAAALAVLVVAGTFLAWRVAETWEALLGTGYGPILLVKVLAALVAIAVATWNRLVLVPRLRAATRRRDRRAPSTLLIRATRAEAGVLVAVLLVTGFLVDRSPEPSGDLTAGAVSSQGASEQVLLDDVRAEVGLDPVAIGPATVSVAMTDAAGEPVEGYDAPRLSLRSEGVDLGEVPVRSLGPGVYAGDVVLPTAGEWTVQVSLRTTEFDNPVRTVTFVVPGPGSRP
nr:CopD family protein [Isoptericola chiayiensis]